MTRRSTSRLALDTALCFAALAVIFSLSGCGSDGLITERYEAERMAWKVRQLERAVRLNPELNSEEMRSRILEGYREIIAAYPPAGEPASLEGDAALIAGIAGRARLALAGALAEADEYEEAIEIAESVWERYRFNRGLAVDAALLVARIHSAAGDWERSVLAYGALSRELTPATSREAAPDTRILRAPLRIALGYQLRGDSENAARWFGEARSYYERLAGEWQGTPTAEAASGILAEAYTYEKRWREALDAYDAFDRAYGAEHNRATLWLRMAELYEKRIGSPDQAREYYVRVVDGYPGDPAFATAAVALAQQAMRDERFGEAREWLGRVLADFEDEEAVAATARHAVALSYEMEGRWDEAVPEYRALARDYPTTMFGLAALLHVADHYSEVGESGAAATAYEQAAEQYERIARDYAATGAEFAALNYLVETRLKQERWKDAADVLVEASSRLAESPAAPEMLFQAADLYETRLSDRASAASALRKLVGSYPKSEWAARAGERLEALGG